MQEIVVDSSRYDREMRRFMSACVLAVACIAPANAVEQTRTTKSLSTRWSSEVSAETRAFGRHSIFVAKDATVSAIDAATGLLKWQRTLPLPDCPRPKIVTSGNVVAFSDGEAIFLLDAATGRLLTTSRHEAVQDLIAPPLIALIATNDSLVATALDQSTGGTGVRRRIPHEYVLADALLIFEEDERLIALDDSLKEKWRVDLPEEEFLSLVSIEGAPFLVAMKNGDDGFIPVDAKTGKLGPALPPRAPTSLRVHPPESWEFQWIDSRDRNRYRLNDRVSGSAVWELELSCQVRSLIRRGDSVTTYCQTPRGRSRVITLDWKTGAIRGSAPALRGTAELHDYGTHVVAAGDQGLISFEPGRYVDVEISLSTAVDEILRPPASNDRYATRRYIDDTVADLGALGAGALPIITKRIPGLDARTLAAVARVVGDAGYAPAGAPLASTLSRPVVVRGKYGLWTDMDPHMAVLDALAKMGEDSSLASKVTPLLTPSNDAEVRRKAFMCLVSLGGPDASVAIDRALAIERPASWWKSEVPSAAAGWEFLQRVPIGDGIDGALYRHSKLGGPHDLWLSHFDEKGAVDEARFLGVSLHTKGRLVWEEAHVSAAASGNKFRITRESSGKTVEVDLHEIELDGDKDGLPDLVEERLQLNAKSADTDGDGVSDSHDFAPNAGRRPPSDDERVLLDVLEQFDLFEPAEMVMIVVDQPALEWRRRSMTLTLSKDANQRFHASAGYNGVARISIVPSKKPALATDELAFSLTSYRGGLNAVGYRIVMKKRGKRWLMREMVMEWIS